MWLFIFICIFIACLYLLHSGLGKLADPWCVAAPRLVISGRSLLGFTGGQRTTWRPHSGQPFFNYYLFFSSALFNSLCCFMLNRFMLNLCLRKGDVFNGVGFIFQDAWWSPAIDFLLYWPAWLCVILLEVLWLFLTFQLPVPDCPA